MRVRLLLLAVISLLLTLLVPAAADAAGGDNWWQQHCPSGYDGPDHRGVCTKTTTETFKADAISHFHCPAGYTGPDQANQCTKIDVESFAADPVYDYRCPADYTGPDANMLCEKATTLVETIHVDEVITAVCPDGWAENSNGDCAFSYPALQQVPVAVADIISCPDPIVIGDNEYEFELSSDRSQCIAEWQEPSFVDAAVVVTYRCPATFALQADNTCTRTDAQTEFAGKVQGPLAVDCPAEAPFDAAAGTCATRVPAKTTYQCEAGFTLDDTTVPPTCSNASVQGTLIYGLDCPAPLGVLETVMPGMGTCLLTVSPFDIISYVCPTGYTEVAGGLSDMLCSRDDTVTTTIDAVAIPELSCDFGPGPIFSGPNADGQCVAFNPVAVVEFSIVTAEYFCGNALGPDANNECFQIITTTITTPPIDLPSFTCPADYAGPDADWNCTRTIDGVDIIDAEEFISSYDCPDDSRGPNADNLCARDLIETIDADEKITYLCPDDAHGAKDGKCTRRHTEYTKVGAAKQCRARYFHRWGHYC